MLRLRVKKFLLVEVKMCSPAAQHGGELSVTCRLDEQAENDSPLIVIKYRWRGFVSFLSRLSIRGSLDDFFLMFFIKFLISTVLLKKHEDNLEIIRTHLPPQPKCRLRRLPLPSKRDKTFISLSNVFGSVASFQFKGKPLHFVFFRRKAVMLSKPFVFWHARRNRVFARITYEWDLLNLKIKPYATLIIR